MANASLQIGNGNWAIKEDNLLGYSKAGTRFFPIPITMTRATLGTRVNPSGLIEDVELLGSELVTNGSFNTTIPIGDNGSGWAKVVSGDCTVEYDNGGVKLTQASVGNQDCKIYARTVGGSDNLLTVGKQYKVTYEVLSNNNSTDLKYYRGGTYLQIEHTVGTHTFYYEQESNQLSIFWNLTANSDVTLDNISIKEATIDDLARVDYTDGTGSLLVEPQRTNTVTYSEDFSQYTTGGTAPTLTTGQLAPDGTLTATKVSGVIGSTSLYKVGESSTTATRSIYARTVSGTGTAKLLSYFGNTNNTFTLTEEWQRFELTGSIVTGGTNFYAVDFRDSSSTLSEVIVWGAQSEEATYATSYIKTQGSTVTRNQDEYSKTGISDKINSEEGVLFVEMAALSDDLTGRSISLNDGTYTNTVILRYLDLSNQIQGVVRIGGSFKGICTHTLSDSTISIKVAYKWKDSDFALWINGSEVATSSDVGAFSTNTINKLSFDRGDNTQDFFGKVRQVQVFKTALSDSELATLTT